MPPSSSNSRRTIKRPVLVVHGGAGFLSKEILPPERIVCYRAGLKRALQAGYKVLEDGANALEAVTAAVVVLEDDDNFNSSKGACFNIAGFHELDASVMTSAPTRDDLPVSRRGAAVTLIKHVKNPIKLAKELYEDPKACPHVFLSGDDAERIAKDKDLEMVENSYYDTERAWKDHERNMPPEPSDASTSTLANQMDEKKPVLYTAYEAPPLGTVGCVAVDAEGRVACATSTGGKTNKNVGRIGDTPSMGSGFWAETWTPPRRSLLSRLCSFAIKDILPPRAVAISGTGDGDYFIRQNTAHELISRLKLVPRYSYASTPRARGNALVKAGQSVIDDLTEMDGVGGLIAIDENGNFTMPLNCEGMFRGVIGDIDDLTPRVAVWKDEKLSSD